MAYDAKAVANAFLDIASEAGLTLTPMKLQKLIYFAHGWHLALYDEPLIADPVEAWDFGPVVPSVYHAFKDARKGAITSRATDIDWDNLEFVPVTLPEDERTTRLLKKVWDTYGKLSAVSLSNLTHLPGTPWHRATQAAPDARGVVITDDAIKGYFKDSLERNRRDSQQQGA